MRTLGQKRAEFALLQVTKFTSELDKDNKDKFKSFAAGTPSMILQNGLGHTLAFWVSKSKNENDKHGFVFKCVNKWLIEGGFIEKEVNNKAAFLLKVSQMNQNDYLKIQRETISFLEWVKCYAHAEF